MPRLLTRNSLQSARPRSSWLRKRFGIMTLADSNVWLALALSKHEFHVTVRTWMEERKPPEVALFCRSTQQSFLRLLTTTAVLAPYGIPALSNKAAWSAYERFLADKRISQV